MALVCSKLACYLTQYSVALSPDKKAILNNLAQMSLDI